MDLPCHLLKTCYVTCSWSAIALSATATPKLLSDPQVHAMYNWPRIAARTEVVYKAAVISQRDDSLMGRFCRYYLCGSWFGKICCCVAAVMHLYWRWLELMYPRDDMDIVPDFPLKTVAPS